MTRDSTSGPESASPWAGEVPIPEAPVEFTWTQTGDDAGNHGGPAGAPVPGPPTLLNPAQAGGDPNGAMMGPTGDGGDGSDGGGTEAETRRRQRNGLLAGAAAVVLAAVAWVAFNSDETVDLGALGEPTEAEPADSLPSIDDAEPNDPDDPDGDVDDDESDGDDDADVDGTGTAPAVVESDPAEWRQDVIEVPEALRATSESFEVVALTGDGNVVDIDVPSGRVDLIEVGRNVSGRVVAGETATLFTTFSSTLGGQLLRVGEPPLVLSLPQNVDVSQLGAVGDVFVGTAYGNAGDPIYVTVMADGGVLATSGDRSDRLAWQTQFTGDGRAVVSESSGVFVQGEDGYERISDGTLISLSSNHFLVRECDDAMTCGYATIELESGERSVAMIEDPESGYYGFGSGYVSPDGRWLSHIEYTDNSVEHVLIDLTTGERTMFDAGQLSPVQSDEVWAADSSGYFRTATGAGLEFYDVATGTVTPFGEELGRITSFDVRLTPSEPLPPPITALTTGVELIGMTTTGDIVEIDVDSGAVVTTEGIGAFADGAITAAADDAGATFISVDDIPSRRFIAEEGMVVGIDGAGPNPVGPLIAGPLQGTFWMLDTDSSPSSLTLDLVDAAGSRLDEAKIDFDGLDLNRVVGSDGAGGVLVSPDLGGVYTLGDGRGPERVTTGELLAIDASTAYVRECDIALLCGEFRIDRATGERVAVDNDGFARAVDISNRGVPSGQNVSPDGIVAFVRDGDDATRCMMIDTAASSEQWTGVPCVDLASPIIWTPDSNYAIWMDAGAIVVFERTSRSVRVLNTAALSAVAAVPSTESVEPSDETPAEQPA